ncbi:MAG: phosphotransferase [archaeon]|nr:phosphotransferase [archaeon]
MTSGSEKTMDLEIGRACPPDVGQEEALQLLMQAYPRPPSIATPAPRAAQLSALASERDVNYRVGWEDTEYLLKIVNPAEPPEETDFQNAVLLHIGLTLPSLLSATSPGLLVPQPVPTLQGHHVLRHRCAADGRWTPVRLLSWVPGVPVKLRIAASQGQPTDALRFNMGVALATLDLALQGFSHPAGSRVFYWDIAHAPLLRPLLAYITEDAEAQLIEALLADFEQRVAPRLGLLRRQIIFNDLNPDNILCASVDDDRISGIIDFGDAVEGTIAAELAVAAAYIFHSEPDPIASVAAFLRGFASVLPILQAEIEALFDLIRMRFVITLLITGWRCRLHPDNASYLMQWNRFSWAQLQRCATMDPHSITSFFWDVVRSSSSPTTSIQE